MVAGSNVWFNVWRMNTDTDDDYVGGALITGTVAYYSVRGRFQGIAPEQVFRDQGLETDRIFRAVLPRHGLDIRERDEVVIVKPFNHVYKDDRFRITGIRYADFNAAEDRSYMILELSRSIRAHDQQ